MLEDLLPSSSLKVLHWTHDKSERSYTHGVRWPKGIQELLTLHPDISGPKPTSCQATYRTGQVAGDRECWLFPSISRVSCRGGSCHQCWPISLTPMAPAYPHGELAWREGDVQSASGASGNAGSCCSQEQSSGRDSKGPRMSYISDNTSGHVLRHRTAGDCHQSTAT